jgi:hypothetical protein
MLDVAEIVKLRRQQPAPRGFIKKYWDIYDPEKRP